MSSIYFFYLFLGILLNLSKYWLFLRNNSQHFDVFPNFDAFGPSYLMGLPSKFRRKHQGNWCLLSPKEPRLKFVGIEICNHTWFVVL